MRAVTLAGLMMSAALAGCFGGDTDMPARESSSSSTSTAIIHGALPVGTEPEIIAAAVWLDQVGQLPVAAWRPVGYHGSEPTLGTQGGALYVGAWSFLGQGRGQEYVVKSADAGLTWEGVTHKKQGRSVPPASSDPYLHVDTAGRIYDLNMYGAQCHWLETSDDGGDSWTSHPAACPQGSPINDHPTLWTDQDHVFVCGNGQAYTACGVSEDGGSTWGPFVRVPWPLDDPAALLPDNPADPTQNLGGHTGHGVASPDGASYVATSGSLVGGVPHIARTTDDGQSWQVFPITEDEAYRLPAEMGGWTAHDVELAVDASGRVYAFWTNPGRDILMATSEDRAATWSEPVVVSAPSVGTTSFTTVAGGASGRVALAYYGAARDVDYHEMTDDDAWGAYLAIIDAVGEAPMVATVAANLTGDPVARGQCESTTMVRCHGVTDFIDVVIDEEGRPWAAFVDVCSGRCITEPGAPTSNSLALGTFAAGAALHGGNLTALTPWHPTTERFPFEGIAGYQAPATSVGLFHVTDVPVSIEIWWNATPPVDVALTVYDSSNSNSQAFTATPAPTGHFSIDGVFAQGDGTILATVDPAGPARVSGEVLVRYAEDHVNEETMPDRPSADMYYEASNTIWDAYWGVDP